MNIYISGFKNQNKKIYEQQKTHVLFHVYGEKKQHADKSIESFCRGKLL